MRREELDYRQRQVVETVLKTDSKLLVLGGPGSGKTTTALWAAREFLENSDRTSPSRVLFLTFSRAAVSQIVSRSPGVIAGFEDRVEILTFHALAYRLIRAFGRYAGFGQTPPSVQSEARVKLLGQDRYHLRYCDLVPAAINILKRSHRIRELVSIRWGLVICDEVQDTNDEQWELLQVLAPRKLLLLGDANQMIYTFICGVSPERFREIRQWVDREIELQSRSHRDPSGTIPALAEAIRIRQFSHQAVVDALKTGRLVIYTDVEHTRHREILVTEIRRARELGSHNIGIFAHSNQAVAELAETLESAGIDHVLVGIPEAHAEALSAMAHQCAYAVGLATPAELRQSLALFLTATVRSKQPPEMALALIGKLPLPERVENAIIQLEGALKSTVTGTVGDLVAVAMRSWMNLGITAGYRPWGRAADHFRRLVFPFRDQPVSTEVVQQFMAIIEQSRVEALIDLDYSEKGRVKLMNFHQTKGREADTVIHVFRSDDYFGRETEPFDTASRLLYVAISRARQRVVVVLPPDPHPLVKPLMTLAMQEELWHEAGASSEEIPN